MNFFEWEESAIPQISEDISEGVLEDVCIKYKQKIATLQSQNPLVSIIIPAHNEEKYMLHMIASVSKIRTQFPLEIIWVNNWSTDRTGAIFEQCWFKCLTENKKWTSHARQIGLEAAKGTYIFTTDADTLVPDTWVEKSLSYFKQNDNLAFLSGWLEFVGAHWSFYCAQNILKIGRFLLGKEYKLRSCFSGANSVFKRNIAIQVGGYEAWRDKGEDMLIARKIGNYGEIIGISDDHEIRVSTSGRRFSSIPKVMRHALWWRSGCSLHHECPEMEKDFKDIR